MHKQSFSVENFHTIFERESRKGVNLEKRFFPKVLKISKENKKYDKDTEERKEILKQKNKLLEADLTKISAKINDKNFSPAIKELKKIDDKPVYGIEEDASSYFAIKQVQYNIGNLYKVKQSNRFNIIPQLRDVLSDNFPKYIIRIDIADFYESIPRNRILDKLNTDNLLAPISKKIIRHTLYKYGEISGNNDGLPRGIGISAYLAELYMRRFDENIKRCSDIIYYARYVDDIIIVYSLDSNANGRIKRFKMVQKEVEKFGLKLNGKKTNKIIINSKVKQFEFEYLGYKFSFINKKINLSMSNNKIEKYEDRIKKAFIDYNKSVKYNEKNANRMLIKRVRFLAGNTRLINNKENIIIGIYFSHNFISDSSCLHCLDECLKTQIKKIDNEKVKKKLSEISFVEGFDGKKFFRFSINEYKKIVSVW